MLWIGIETTPKFKHLCASHSENSPLYIVSLLQATKYFPLARSLFSFKSEFRILLNNLSLNQMGFSWKQLMKIYLIVADKFNSSLKSVMDIQTFLYIFNYVLTVSIELNPYCCHKTCWQALSLTCAQFVYSILFIVCVILSTFSFWFIALFALWLNLFVLCLRVQQGFIKAPWHYKYFYFHLCNVSLTSAVAVAATVACCSGCFPFDTSIS